MFFRIRLTHFSCFFHLQRNQRVEEFERKEKRRKKKGERRREKEGRRDKTKEGGDEADGTVEMEEGDDESKEKEEEEEQFMAKIRGVPTKKKIDVGGGGEGVEQVQSDAFPWHTVLVGESADTSDSQELPTSPFSSSHCMSVVQKQQQIERAQKEQRQLEYHQMEDFSSFVSNQPPKMREVIPLSLRDVHRIVCEMMTILDVSLKQAMLRTTFPNGCENSLCGDCRHCRPLFCGKCNACSGSFFQLMLPFFFG